MPTPFKGLLVPMLTPFDEDGKPDAVRALRFGKDLLASGASGLALFGTTSEGQSLGVQERLDLLDALLDGGIAPDQLMVGTGSCALSEAIHMTREVVVRKCGGVLMLPPYFYKVATDAGLYRFFAELIEAVGSPGLKIYLYHIPPVAHVGFSVELIAQLFEAYPEQIIGVKNSSGDHGYSVALRERCPGFDVFCGSEDFLLETMKIGGVGCISATGNVNSREIVHLYQQADTLRAEKLQALVTDIRAVIQKRPMIAALKAIVARNYNDAGWRKTRTPLVELPDEDADVLIEQLERHGFYANRLFT
ncbi:MAG: dihydrodipicolinate synthase family protein [Verrucomicrobiae bacterium]|nr:dihydrodipicolinate synthase family protein [Verrucomicrobiae bacterium]